MAIFVQIDKRDKLNRAEQELLVKRIVKRINKSKQAIGRVYGDEVSDSFPPEKEYEYAWIQSAPSKTPEGHEYTVNNLLVSTRLKYEADTLEDDVWTETIFNNFEEYRYFELNIKIDPA